ncbi:hypothetical protein B7H01_16215 [Pandoraea apista]|nr:hypothetical protein B7H01_16215 [Pandoraea apista]
MAPVVPRKGLAESSAVLLEKVPVPLRCGRRRLLEVIRIIESVLLGRRLRELEMPLSASPRQHIRAVPGLLSPNANKTDTTGDIRQAQKQLGHTSVTMTEHYVRNRRGDKVKPTK